MRLRREALVRRWLKIPLSRLIEQLRPPTPALLDQLAFHHENVGKPQNLTPFPDDRIFVYGFD
jgi:hypothetical protein